METKLTLRLNKRIIDRAKNYAHTHNISLSKLIESYLDFLTKQKAATRDISPLVKSLSGVIQMDENFDYQNDYSNYLSEKYK